MARRSRSASPAGTHEDVGDTVDSSTTDDVTPGSSPETEELSSSEGMLDAMSEAVEDLDSEELDDTSGDQDSNDQDDEDPDSVEGDKSKPGEEGKDDKDAGDKDQKDDDGDDLEPGQRVPYDRFKAQVDARKQFAQERDAAIQERDQYRQGHERFNAIAEFRDRNNLSDQDVVQALKIAGAINRDPVQALEQLKPIYARLSELAGDTLPKDIQARVDTGELSETDARDLVKTRNENARLKQQREQHDQQSQQADLRARQQEAQRAMATAASAEENRLAGKDPDFKTKLPLIQPRLRVLIQEKPPRSPEEAAGLVREAYEAVNADLGSFTRREPVRKGVRSDEGGKGSGSQEPKSMLEAMEQAANPS